LYSQKEGKKETIRTTELDERMDQPEPILPITTAACPDGWMDGLIDCRLQTIYIDDARPQKWRQEPWGVETSRCKT
jgi:hypothetical protein